MALDLGELVGFLEIDPTRWNRGIDDALRSIDTFGDKTKPRAETAGRKAGDAFGSGLVPETTKAGEEGGEKAGDGLLSKGKVAASAAGAAVGIAFWQAMDIDAGRDKLAAQLGATLGQSERYGRVAGTLYADAYGESLDDVNAAVGAVVSSIDGMDTKAGARLKRLTARALDFSTAFEVDVQRAVQVAGTVIDSKLARNGVRALDLLTKGAQGVPAALREDLLDAVEEYGQFFRSLGYTGPQAFALLVDASEKGVYGIDKAGDAVKEFTIRSTDMSTASKDAYKFIGLNAREMADAILKGGDDAKEATDKVIDGLLAIESPSKRANAAIALFGTPIEDLNVRDIPAFLRNLKGGSDSMDDFAGASKRMGDTLNDNASAKLTAFKRKVQTEVTDFFVDEGIPALERFGRWFEREGGPALRDFWEDAKPVRNVVGDLVELLNDMPTGAKIAALGSTLAGGLVVKHKLAGMFERGSFANPMFVTVMNKGGLPDGPGDGPDKKPPVVAPWMKTLARGGALASPLWATLGLWKFDENQRKDWSDERSNSGTTVGSPFGGVSRYNSHLGGMDFDKINKNLEDAGYLGKEFLDTLDLADSKHVVPKVDKKPLTGANLLLDEFLGKQKAAGRPVTPRIDTSSIDHAIERLTTMLTLANPAAGPLGAAVAGAVRAGGDGNPNGRRSPFDGATFNVQPPNYDAFARDMDRRARGASDGWVGPGARR